MGIPLSAVTGARRLFTSGRGYGSTFAILGDSLDLGGVANGMTDQMGIDGTTYMGYVAVKSNGRYRPHRNRGVGGETTAQMLARVPEITSLADRPDFCFVGAGRNDCDVVGGGESHLRDTESAVQQLLNSGILPILLTVPPKDSATFLEQWNMQLMNIGRKLMAERYGIPCVDRARVVSDDSDGEYVAAYTVDGVHQSEAGAIIEADHIIEVLNGTYSPIPTYLPLVPMDATGLVRNDWLNLHRNGCFIDTDANDYPDAWGTQSAALTRTLPTAAGVAGNWFKSVNGTGGVATTYVVIGTLTTVVYDGVTNSLTIDAVSNTKVTATPALDANALKQVLYISGGTGFTPGFYLMKAHAAGVITLDRACGTVGSTGGTGQKGNGGGFQPGDKMLYTGAFRASGFTAGSYQIGMGLTSGSPNIARPALSWTGTLNATLGYIFRQNIVIPSATTAIVPQVYFNGGADTAEMWVRQFGLYNLTLLPGLANLSLPI